MKTYQTRRGREGGSGSLEAAKITLLVYETNTPCKLKYLSLSSYRWCLINHPWIFHKFSDFVQIFISKRNLASFSREVKQMELQKREKFSTFFFPKNDFYYSYPFAFLPLCNEVRWTNKLSDMILSLIFSLQEKFFVTWNRMLFLLFLFEIRTWKAGRKFECRFLSIKIFLIFCLTNWLFIYLTVDSFLNCLLNGSAWTFAFLLQNIIQQTFCPPLINYFLSYFREKIYIYIHQSFQ